MNKQTALEDKEEIKVSLLHKVGYLFDKKQKRQLVGLGVLIFIGGFLETLGVSMLLPVVQVIMDPDAIMDNPLVAKR